MNNTIVPEEKLPETLPEREREYRQALDCIEQQEFGQAISILDELAGAASRDAKLRYARAVALLSNGEYRRAGTDLAFTVALDRSNLEAYRHLGFVLLTMGKEEAAIKVLEEALRRDPCFVEAWCVLADVHMDLGEHEKALDALDKAHELQPRNVEVHCKLAMYYMSRGDMRGLRAEYEVLREIEPDVAAQIAELLP
ncbi:tetratricopeptide repeat protein [Chlorobaculum sp. 24CR]|uniref:tetratricopeptide repeat protein n=1 Tax=Chlorobaculum sp. 24CR TaxID=2508878 RepID=UPI001FD6B220|nr:tetratricopeptide repeat protein [Chlorobaculum sp. 24CR]